MHGIADTMAATAKRRASRARERRSSRRLRRRSSVRTGCAVRPARPRRHADAAIADVEGEEAGMRNSFQLFGSWLLA